MRGRGLGRGSSPDSDAPRTSSECRSAPRQVRGSAPWWAAAGSCKCHEAPGQGEASGSRGLRLGAGADAAVQTPSSIHVSFYQNSGLTGVPAASSSY